jgi:hypothetical protein
LSAQPLGDVHKKGANRGIHGRITFTIGHEGEMGQALASIKSGHANSSMIRDLKDTIEREGAQIGLLITVEAVARDGAAGHRRRLLHLPHLGRGLPPHSDLTIRELLKEHKKPMLPLLILPTSEQTERMCAEKVTTQRGMLGWAL